MNTVQSKYAGLPPAWQELRQTAASAGHCLAPAVYGQIRQIFLAEYASPDAPGPVQWTREYDLNEYLRVVDQTGQPVWPSGGVVDDFAGLVADYPHYARWFQFGQDRLAHGSTRGWLLPARWLCHLVGLRHVTVEMFIDLPDQVDTTLVQIRGLGKAESPGDFDLPCAGHVSGIDDIAASMAKELQEELGLGLVDLDELAEISRFDAPAGGEFRVLYQGRLKQGRFNQIRLQEEEVAGLAVMRLPELRLLVERLPERTASGLREAIRYYRVR